MKQAFESSINHSDFSILNLPYGIGKVIRPPNGVEAKWQPFTRLGEYGICLTTLINVTSSSVKCPFPHVIVGQTSLNALMGLGKAQRVRFREWLKESIQHVLQADQHPQQQQQQQQQQQHGKEQLVYPIEAVQMGLPCIIGDYTDFYASKEHATNAGTIFRGKEDALQPNWTSLPVGYHGRSSSIVVSPTKLIRPNGQLRKQVYGLCEKLDFELEIGIFIAQGNDLGKPVTVEEARDMVFGYVLLNDWSARDIQAWEYVPLGPFCGKNFCTSISPWIIPQEALDKYTISPSVGETQSVAPLPYLYDKLYKLYDLELEVVLKINQEEFLLSKSHFRNLFWTPPQMIAHHTSGGCNLRPGDLLGTGTISGENVGSFGCLLEITWNGTKPIVLSSEKNIKRSYLMDNDVVIMRGRVPNRCGIGFGDLVGQVVAGQNHHHSKI